MVPRETASLSILSVTPSGGVPAVARRTGAATAFAEVLGALPTAAAPRQATAAPGTTLPVTVPVLAVDTGGAAIQGGAPSPPAVPALSDPAGIVDSGVPAAGQDPVPIPDGAVPTARLAPATINPAPLAPTLEGEPPTVTAVKPEDLAIVAPVPDPARTTANAPAALGHVAPAVPLTSMAGTALGIEAAPPVVEDPGKHDTAAARTAPKRATPTRADATFVKRTRGKDLDSQKPDAVDAPGATPPEQKPTVADLPVLAPAGPGTPIVAEEDTRPDTPAPTAARGQTAPSPAPVRHTAKPPAAALATLDVSGQMSTDPSGSRSTLRTLASGARAEAPVEASVLPAEARTALASAAIGPGVPIAAATWPQMPAWVQTRDGEPYAPVQAGVVPVTPTEIAYSTSALSAAALPAAAPIAAAIAPSAPLPAALPLAAANSVLSPGAPTTDTPTATAPPATALERTAVPAAFPVLAEAVLTPPAAAAAAFVAPSEQTAALASAPAALPVPAGAVSAPAPAGRVFAAALHLAVTGEDRRRPAAVPALPASAAAVVSPNIPTAPATTPRTTPPVDLTDHRWPAGMIERIEAMRDDADGASTRIRFAPDALGPVELHVRHDVAGVHLHFTAAQAGTRAILQDAQPELARIAAERGLKLGESTVGGGDGQPRQRATPPAPARFSAPRAATTADPVDELSDIRIA